MHPILYDAALALHNVTGFRALGKRKRRQADDEPQKRRRPGKALGVGYPESGREIRASIAYDDHEAPQGELGTTGLNATGGQIIDDYNSSMQNLSTRMARYQEMYNSDTAIGAMEQLIVPPIQSAKWEITPHQDDKSDAGKYLAERMHRNIIEGEGMSHSWRELLEQVLDAPFFGFALTEPVWDTQTNGVDGPRTVLRKFARRERTSVQQWDFDDEGGLKGYWFRGQRPDGTYINRQYIPIDRLVVWTWRGKGRNPEGMGCLRRAWKAHRYEEQLSHWALVRVERSATGLWVAQPTTDDIEVTEAEAMTIRAVLSRIRAGNDVGIVLPGPNWKLDLTWPGSSDIPWESMIERQRQYKLQSMLCHFVGLSQGGDKGSFGLSKDHSSMFISSLRATADWVADIFNQYVVPRWVAYNHSGRPRYMPVLRHGQIGLRDLTPFANYIRALMDMNVFVPPDLTNVVLEEAGLPPLTDEDAKIRAEAFQLHFSKNVPGVASAVDGQQDDQEDTSDAATERARSTDGSSSE